MHVEIDSRLASVKTVSCERVNNPSSDKQSICVFKVYVALSKQHPSFLPSTPPCLLDRYYKPSVLLMCFFVPMFVPCYLWGESLWVAYFVPALLRYTLVLNATWLVNSAAHMWGNRPYDKNINPRENKFVTFSAIGMKDTCSHYNKRTATYRRNAVSFCRIVRSWYVYLLPNFGSTVLSRVTHKQIWQENSAKYTNLADSVLRAKTLNLNNLNVSYTLSSFAESDLTVSWF